MTRRVEEKEEVRVRVNKQNDPISVTDQAQRNATRRLGQTGSRRSPNRKHWFTTSFLQQMPCLVRS